jgi:hypothetical protein
MDKAEPMAAPCHDEEDEDDDDNNIGPTEEVSRDGKISSPAPGG